jgi:alpha-tubulin suppressor-like RCC1 family protein
VDSVGTSTGLTHTHDINDEGYLDGAGVEKPPIHSIVVDTTTQQLPVRNNRLAAGAYHVLFVDDDNSLWTWGYNCHGQLGNGTTDNQFRPVKVLENVAYVDAVGNTSMAIQTNGTLWAWGDNSSGQLGDGTRLSQSKPVKILTNVSHVSATDWFSVFVLTDGCLYGIVDAFTLTYVDWPPFFLEGLALGEPFAPVKLINERVVYVSADYDHIMAITEDGVLLGWGRNVEGSVGVGATFITDESYMYTSVFQPTPIMDNVAYVSASAERTSVVTNCGELWSWGLNYLMTLSRINSGVPVKLMGGIAVTPTAAQFGFSITESGQLLGWAFDLIDTKIESGVHFPGIEDPLLLLENVSEAVRGVDFFIALTHSGELLAWGNNNYGQLGISAEIQRVSFSDPARIAKNVKE